MSDELKPCPWCGNEPTLREYEGGWIIECEHHGWHESGEEAPRDETIAGDVDMCSWGSTESAKAALIAAWNARAAVTDEQFSLAVRDGREWQVVRECRNVGEETDDDFKCSLCGESYNESDDMAMPASRIDWCFSCGARVVR